MDDAPPAYGSLQRPAAADHSAVTSSGYAKTRRQFAAMEHVYRLAGGLLTLDQVENLRAHRRDHDAAVLLRWIIERRVVSFDWESLILLPMFQFDAFDWSIRPACGELIRVLSTGLNDWEIAVWLTSPNMWLGFAIPVARLGSDPGFVLDAARAAVSAQWE